jgi:hypothetical protein
VKVLSPSEAATDKVIASCCKAGATEKCWWWLEYVIAYYRPENPKPTSDERAVWIAGKVHWLTQQLKQADQKNPDNEYARSEAVRRVIGDIDSVIDHLDEEGFAAIKSTKVIAEAIALCIQVCRIEAAVKLAAQRPRHCGLTMLEEEQLVTAWVKRGGNGCLRESEPMQAERVMPVILADDWVLNDATVEALAKRLLRDQEYAWLEKLIARYPDQPVWRDVKFRDSVFARI